MDGLVVAVAVAALAAGVAAVVAAVVAAAATASAGAAVARGRGGGGLVSMAGDAGYVVGRAVRVGGESITYKLFCNIVAVTGARCMRTYACATCTQFGKLIQQ